MAEVITRLNMQIACCIVGRTFGPNCNSKECNFLLTPMGCLNLILVLTGVIFSKVNPDNCFIWLQLCFALFKNAACFLFTNTCSKKEGILCWRQCKASSTVPSLITFSIFFTTFDLPCFDWTGWDTLSHCCHCITSSKRASFMTMSSQAGLLELRLLSILFNNHKVSVSWCLMRNRIMEVEFLNRIYCGLGNACVTIWLLVFTWYRKSTWLCNLCNNCFLFPWAVWKKGGIFVYCFTWSLGRFVCKF